MDPDSAALALERAVQTLSHAADRYPGECKPPAQWSFRLGCDFRVSEAQLQPLKHPDPARGLQPCNRLSRDLTRVMP